VFNWWAALRRYSHFMEGHNTPLASAQLDGNLVKLIRAAMALPNTAIHVLSDHGGVPRDLPLSVLFLPKTFLNDNPDAAEALRVNQHQYPLRSCEKICRLHPIDSSAVYTDWKSGHAFSATNTCVVL
jgi:hypothetical protein